MLVELEIQIKSYCLFEKPFASCFFHRLQVYFNKLSLKQIKFKTKTS